MGHFAYLTPVGPFAGLSNAARQKIGERFPTLSIVEIESAAAIFFIELQAPKIEPRLAEAREELNTFAKELARFHSALNQVRKYRLGDAVGEASRMISGENEFDDLERSLNNLRTATQLMSRTVPLGRPQFASRRLITTLARHVKHAGLPLRGTAGDSLLSLVNLIFEDLMVGGDATSAVKEWHQSQGADIDHERASRLLDLVP
jgi:hypothetical protein